MIEKNCDMIYNVCVEMRVCQKRRLDRVKSLRGFKAENGYEVKGKIRKNGVTVLLREKGGLVSSLYEKVIEKLSKKARVIIERAPYPQYEEENKSGLLVVLDLTTKDKLKIGYGCVSCGSSLVAFKAKDAVGLEKACKSVASKQNENHLKVTIRKDGEWIEVETLFFNEDRFECFTMELARVVAPYFALVDSRYAYLPIFSSQKHTLSVYETLKLKEEVEILPAPDLKKESFLPLAYGKEVILIEAGTGAINRLED